MRLLSTQLAAPDTHGGAPCVCGWVSVMWVGGAHMGGMWVRGHRTVRALTQLSVRVNECTFTREWLCG